ncbi:acVLRF1 family peptidyl-tRNA hydrolase [Phycicoccus sp. Soil802]|uniref:acVLRF1 family peptidyl-tRNA hydrolase n=1 Tax=Phycicoccus sp. Soil802 TaxID=1736414 RepID=UPI001F30D563|nr:acVLRF1 family peptidyl-tRNA hydrolase [Phycicoccus sp. Soil802]
MGPRQDHRGRPRAAAGPRVQPLSPSPADSRPRVVEVAPERIGGWLERFAANNAERESPQRVTAREEFPHDPVGVLLIRRGGYAVGLADGPAFTESKVGKRHVQSRTAAGGWSQQRFARRRGNQADELVRAVTEHTLRILPRGIPRGLVVGGDKALVRAVLDDPRLAHLDALPRRELYDLPDPRRDVLEDALRRGRAVRVTIEDGPVA